MMLERRRKNIKGIYLICWGTGACFVVWNSTVSLGTQVQAVIRKHASTSNHLETGSYSLLRKERWVKHRGLSDCDVGAWNFDHDKNVTTQPEAFP